MHSKFVAAVFRLLQHWAITAVASENYLVFYQNPMLIRSCTARQTEWDSADAWKQITAPTTYWRIRGNICDCGYLSISYTEKIIEGAMNAPCNATIYMVWTGMCRALCRVGGQSGAETKQQKEAEVTECKKQQTNENQARNRKLKPKKKQTQAISYAMKALVRARCLSQNHWSRHRQEASKS